jgi:hypothetical protein
MNSNISKYQFGNGIGGFAMLESTARENLTQSQELKFQKEVNKTSTEDRVSHFGGKHQA